MNKNDFQFDMRTIMAMGPARFENNEHRLAALSSFVFVAPPAPAGPDSAPAAAAATVAAASHAPIRTKRD